MREDVIAGLEHRNGGLPRGRFRLVALPWNRTHSANVGVILYCLALAAAAPAAADICDRTPEVRDKIVEQLQASDCAGVSDADLASIKNLDLSGSGIAALKPGDFAGLSTLRELRLHQNELTSLPDGLFGGLTSLRELFIQNNRLDSLPSGIFDGLTNLIALFMGNNRLTGTGGRTVRWPARTGRSLFRGQSNHGTAFGYVRRPRQPAVSLLCRQSVDDATQRSVRWPVQAPEPAISRQQHHDVARRDIRRPRQPGTTEPSRQSTDETPQ